MWWLAIAIPVGAAVYVAIAGLVSATLLRDFESEASLLWPLIAPLLLLLTGAGMVFEWPRNAVERRRAAREANAAAVDWLEREYPDAEIQITKSARKAAPGAGLAAPEEE